jgi:phosphoglycolate phosphatase
MKRPRAIVFDLDGTLADTRLDIAAACNHALTSLGRAPRDVGEISRFVGDGARVLMARALGLAPDDPVTAEALTRFNAYYPQHAADHAAWMPGVREALEACGDLPLAVVTNKPRSATVPLLDALGLAPHFRAVVAGGDGPLKPDPAPIRAALEPLGVGPEDAWMVGDGPQDIAAGRAAGAGTVAVLGGFGQESDLRGAGPDRVIPSLHGLAALLRDEGRRTG